MARGGARPGAGRKAGKSAHTSPPSRRARVEAGNQRPWPADKVERWAIDRLIPYAKNARTHTDAQVAAIAASGRRADCWPCPCQRGRAREAAGNQRPWPADKVERWAIDRLIPDAKNSRT